MSLFVCENPECQVIENTALCAYWWSEKKLCSGCDPKFAKWHDRFPQEKYSPELWRYIEGTHYVERITLKKSKATGGVNGRE